MFFIVNTTKNSLCIADLKLTLGPRQGIDLDKRNKREEAEKSQGLKSLVSKGLISIKNKTKPEVQSNFIQEIHNHSEIDTDQMKKEIMEGVKEAIAENMPPQPTPQQPNINMEELAKMIASIIPQLNNNANLNSTPKDEEVKVDEGILADIHSRVVNKIVKNVESGDINYQKEKTSNTIDDNIDELEGLLE
jgi:predicted transcriptional regulator